MHLQPTEIFFPRRNLDPTPRPFSWKRDIPHKTQPQLSFSPATYYWKWKLRLVGCYHNLWDTLLQWSHTKFNNITAKPVLSGYRIKQTPSIKRTVAKVPNLFPFFTLDEILILSGRGHLQCTWNGHFYCCQTVLNGLLQLNSTTQHARHRKCERLLPTNFLIFTLKNVTWWTYLISFTVQYCFLFLFLFLFFCFV